ncbi:hypothetical protein F4781DRAFT_384114 [Annulohypoxylon bovei var. microspora]|nr:hypothetical protein F4781DRAFT_384114 [Annulohypoxylon bovei var. microspora]
MRSFSRSSLFPKKSKSNLQSRKDSLDEQAAQHSRKWSTSSTASQASSTASHDRLYDPLSLHPPLSLNTSPHMIPEYEEDAEREHRFFDQTHHADDHLQDSAEYSPIKGRNCYLRRPSEVRPYVYDQGEQWPLKDWQAIPPGLAELDSSATSPVGSPTQSTNHRRRPTQWMHESDAMLKRGDWKRRGIVFHLDETDERDQEQHFELPEC